VFVKNAVIRGQVAILSEQLWTRHFGRRADIVGRPITLDDRPGHCRRRPARALLLLLRPMLIVFGVQSSLS
jgi:hypothetical protein